MNKEYRRKYYQEHKEEISRLNKEKYQREKEKIKARCEEYYKTHKEEQKARVHKYYQEHIEEYREKAREHFHAHKEEYAMYNKLYYTFGREKGSKLFKEWQKEYIKTKESQNDKKAVEGNDELP